MALAEGDRLAAPASEPPRHDRARGAIAAVVAVFALLSLVRVITGADDLTSSGTFGSALRLAVPIGLVGLGALFAERAGVVNIGLEGMMILGTWFGAWAGFEFGAWWGIPFGMLGGAAGGLLHAVATVTFGVDHVISGVAVNILGGGVARFLSVIAYEEGSGGGANQSPKVKGTIGTFDLPLLPDAFGWLERRRWVLVSDLGGLGKGLTGGLSWLTLLAALMVPLSFFVLWRTRFGLRLRSVGENPTAADSLGVPVYRMKYAGVVISGALAGMGGAFLVLVSTGIYREGQTAGRGFIGLAALIFGNWRPVGVAVGATLFGFADALQLRNQEAVHALVLFVSLVLAAVAVRSFVRAKPRAAVVPAALAVGAYLYYRSVDVVPSQFVFFTPHLATLLVLSLAAQRLRPPAADGRPWRKGDG